MPGPTSQMTSFCKHSNLAFRSWQVVYRSFGNRMHANLVTEPWCERAHQPSGPAQLHR